MTENELSRVVIGAAIEVHQTLGGPGLLEVVYEEALAFELELRGIASARQVPCPVRYKDKLLSKPLSIDLLIGGILIVECKATVEHHDIYEAQLLTYLRLTGLKLGLVINFGQKQVKDGVKRVVNGL